MHPLPGSAVHMEPCKAPLPSVRGEGGGGFPGSKANIWRWEGAGPKTACASSSCSLMIQHACTLSLE